MHIGPASIKGEISGPVRVMHGEEIASFGNERDASKFAQGYNRAWWSLEAKIKKHLDDVNISATKKTERIEDIFRGD